jgi:sugar O-acyltransferase (sialic acid O-acetyltransferase NeuD family)
MRKKILIFPYNGNGLEALDCLGDEYECIGFIDDKKEKQGKQDKGCAVFSRNVLQVYPEAFVLAVPGSPSSYLARKEQINSLGVSPERFVTIMHPKAVVSCTAKVGYNVLIMAGVVITSNAMIENHVCVLPNSVIHHDTKISNYSIIGSQVVIAGHTLVEENCYIGSGSSIINNISIGKGAMVGMGSTVIKHVASYTTVAGNPARIL